MRRHDWIIDVLSDLCDYAVANGLAETAHSVEGALAVLRREAAIADPSTHRQKDRPGRAH